MTVDEFLAYQNRQKERRTPKLHEHNIQVACVNWFKATYDRKGYVIFAVPNAAQRSRHLGRMMKDEGLLPGSPDLVIVTPYGVLFVELKTKTGRLQDTQKLFRDKVEKMGYRYIVCRSCPEFKLAVENWIKDVTKV